MTRCFAIGWPSWSACDQCYRVSKYLRPDLTSVKPKIAANKDTKDKLSTCFLLNMETMERSLKLIFNRKCVSTQWSICVRNFTGQTLCWKFVSVLVILRIGFQFMAVHGPVFSCPHISLSSVEVPCCIFGWPGAHHPDRGCKCHATYVTYSAL